MTNTSHWRHGNACGRRCGSAGRTCSHRWAVRTARSSRDTAVARRAHADRRRATGSIYSGNADAGRPLKAWSKNEARHGDAPMDRHGRLSVRRVGQAAARDRHGDAQADAAFLALRHQFDGSGRVVATSRPRSPIEAADGGRTGRAANAAIVGAHQSAARAGHGAPWQGEQLEAHLRTLEGLHAKAARAELSRRRRRAADAAAGRAGRDAAGAILAVDHRPARAQRQAGFQVELPHPLLPLPRNA